MIPNLTLEHPSPPPSFDTKQEQFDHLQAGPSVLHSSDRTHVCSIVKSELCQGYIEYAKAFDRVHHTKLIECLKGIGIDGKDIHIIRNLYWEQTSCIRIGEEVADQTSIQRGVRQGYVMSPSLFNLYTEIIFRNINELPGMNISGQNINNIRYADYTALVAETPEQLQALLDKVNEESEKCGLAMNAKKTKVMVINRKDITPKIGNTELEQEISITAKWRAAEAGDAPERNGMTTSQNGRATRWCSANDWRRTDVNGGPLQPTFARRRHPDDDEFRKKTVYRTILQC
ncbi:hypothetical protein EGW08_010919 [Elysia chlorotica]|uniref:Reverse transcriptase domain-containing protein n=1 Tax=Elysia chlorotica TaxID=188477 RepID=A0A3S1BDB0_ELYCH|nr:hypothetical protein EGW08_010919 [Elysia chlorotica]